MNEVSRFGFAGHRSSNDKLQRRRESVKCNCLNITHLTFHRQECGTSLVISDKGLFLSKAEYIKYNKTQNDIIF